MHPEVLQAHFGDCPLCGMRLEPVMPDLEDRTADIELAGFRQRFQLALPPTLAVVVLAMIFGVLAALTTPARGWLAFALTLPVVGQAGDLRTGVAVRTPGRSQPVDATRSRRRRRRWSRRVFGRWDRYRFVSNRPR
jgi:hypothetical protein